jgi:ligand-binding sensor domain-containing protein
MEYYRFKFTLLLLFVSFVSFAQEYSYRHYTVQDGLVQSQVVSLYNDSKGYLWIGTKAGASRFDGIKFQNFTKKDGLPDNFIEHIYECSQGFIWLYTRQGLVSIDGCSIHAYSTEHFRDNRGIVYLYEAKAGVIRIVYINLKNQLVFADFSDGKYMDVATFFEENETVDHHAITYKCIFDPSTSSLWILSKPYGLFQLHNDRLFPLYSSVKFASAVIKGNDQKIYVSMNDSVFRWTDNEPEFLFLSKPKSDETHQNTLRVDSKGNIFYTEDFKKIRIFDGQNLFKDQFEVSSIWRMLIDKEDNLWIGTETGLYRLLTRAFVNYIPEKCGINEMIWSVAEDRNGKIWFGSYDSGLQYLEDGRIFSETSWKKVAGVKNLHFYMSTIVDSRKDVLFTLAPIGGLRFDGKNFSPLIPEKPNVAVFFLYEDPIKYDLYAASNEGLYRLRPKQKTEVLDIFPGNGKNKNIVSIAKDKFSRLWLGGFNGISLLDGEEVIHLPTPEIPFERGGNAMLTDHRQNLWIGNAFGLFFYDYDTFQHINHNALGAMVASIAMIGDTSLLIGTVTGLALLDLSEFYDGKKTAVRPIGREQGFMGIEPGQNGIFRDSKGLYWINCSDRVVSFDPALFDMNPVAPMVHITSVELLNPDMQWVARDIERFTKNEFYYSQGEKNFRFEFAGISQSNPEGVVYSHFLEGFDMGWSEPDHERYAVYTNLPPGTYQLFANAGNADGVWNDKPATISFSIIPAYYQQWWFWLILMLILFTFSGWAGYAFSMQRKRRAYLRMENEKKMAQLQLLTIKNQIEPHFTFNALSSMSSLVLKEDRESAYKYFVKISNLLRNVVRTGDKLSCALADELSLLEDYLAIQKLRFKDRFEYEIKVKPGIDMQLQIPKMMLQTFAENALKHGILNLDRPGKLFIQLSPMNPGISIVVEDDGIGREKARQIGSHSTGKGWQIIKGYFEYFNRHNKEKIAWDVIDLYHNDGSAAGTRVLVNIPDSFSFD